MQRPEIVRLEVENPAVSVGRLGSVTEPLLPQRARVEEVRHLPLDCRRLVDRAFVKLDELAVLPGLAVEANECLERRWKPGHQRQSLRVVEGRIRGTPQPALEDLRRTRVRRGSLSRAGAGCGLGQVHLDQPQPILAARQQLSERLQQRRVRGVEPERLAVALNRLLVAPQLSFINTPERVEQGDAIGSLGRQVDDHPEGCGHNLGLAGLSVQAHELLEDHDVAGRARDGGLERGDGFAAIAEALGVNARRSVERQCLIDGVLAAHRRLTEQRNDDVPILPARRDGLERVLGAGRVLVDLQGAQVDLRRGGLVAQIVGEDLCAPDHECRTKPGIRHRVRSALVRLDQSPMLLDRLMAALQSFQNRRVGGIQLQRFRIGGSRAGVVAEGLAQEPRLLVLQRRPLLRFGDDAELGVPEGQRVRESFQLEENAPGAAYAREVIGRLLEGRFVMAERGRHVAQHDLLSPRDLMMQARRAVRRGGPGKLGLARGDDGRRRTLRTLDNDEQIGRQFVGFGGRERRRGADRRPFESGAA